MKIKKENIVAFIIILFIVVIAGGIFGWIFTKKPQPMKRSDENANWQTYRNEKYGFEFKYPKEWPAPELKEGKYYNGGGYPSYRKGDWIVNIGNLASTNEYDDAPYFIGYQNMNYDDIVKDLKKYTNVVIKEEKTLSNGKAIIYTEAGLSGYNCAFFVNSNNAIVFVFDENYRYEDEKLFHQIISTFRFIEPTSPAVSQPHNTQHRKQQRH